MEPVWLLPRQRMSNHHVRILSLIACVLITYMVAFHTSILPTKGFVFPLATDLFDEHNESPIPTFAITERETSPGNWHYTRVNHEETPDVLWLTVTFDASSWGRIPKGEDRSIDHMLGLINEQYDVECVSLGLLTHDMQEYELYKAAVNTTNFARVTIIRHAGFNEGLVVDRDHRHDGDIQTQRRAEIAKVRNYLMLRALGDEQHIVWLDADIWHLKDDVVRRMIRHNKENSEYGIFTTLCTASYAANYDLNAWAGTRQGPRGWDLDEAEIKKGEMKLQGQHHSKELLEGSSDDELIPLTTVGGTILYIRSSLVLQGLSFPHQYVVGTRWLKDGWDGIESEGICYRARGLTGGKCGLLGGSWEVKHADK